MTSGNAFRDGAHIVAAATNSSTNGDTGSPHKRRKLSSSPPPTAPPQANIFVKTGDASVALEVDHMILDFLSFEATNAVIKCRTSRNMNSPNLQHKLDAFDTFLEMFKAKHTHYEPDPELRFRLLLLRFATVYCHRLVRGTVVPSKLELRELRKANTSRAGDWIQCADRMPSNKVDASAFEGEFLSKPDDHEPETNLQHHDGNREAQEKSNATQDHQAALICHRACTLKALGFPIGDELYEDAFYGTSACLALRDILPLFMQVIAARNELNNSNLSKELMELAAQFMLQASLEQYLVFGATGCDAIDETFAWGHKPTKTDASQISNIDPDNPKDTSHEVDRMFQDEDDMTREVPDWDEIKSAYLEELADSGDGLLRRHLENVAKLYPIKAFEEMNLQLLAGLAASLPSPILAQLERGSLDGMSTVETKAFLRSCGLDRHWPNV